MPDRHMRDRSVRDVAAHLHLNPMTVYRWVWGGILPATWDGYQWRLSTAEAEDIYTRRMVRPAPGDPEGRARGGPNH